MKVTFFCDNGANIHSCRKETMDTVDDLGFEEGEWEGLSNEEKQAVVTDWANEHLEIYFEEQS